VAVCQPLSSPPGHLLDAVHCRYPIPTHLMRSTIEGIHSRPGPSSDLLQNRCHIQIRPRRSRSGVSKCRCGPATSKSTTPAAPQLQHEREGPHFPADGRRVQRAGLEAGEQDAGGRLNSACLRWSGTLTRVGGRMVDRYGRRVEVIVLDAATDRSSGSACPGAAFSSGPVPRTRGSGGATTGRSRPRCATSTSSPSSSW
jgi:hypothetical protein